MVAQKHTGQRQLERDALVCIGRQRDSCLQGIGSLSTVSRPFFQRREVDAGINTVSQPGIRIPGQRRQQDSRSFKILFGTLRVEDMCQIEPGALYNIPVITFRQDFIDGHGFGNALLHDVDIGQIKLVVEGVGVVGIGLRERLVG